MRQVLYTALLSCFLCTGTATGAETSVERSDEEIRRILIEKSIEAYEGSCACPYNTNRAGNRCGKTSAYLKNGGGRRPLCYPSDVSPEMVDKYRKEMTGKKE
ncbi:hypothetical protein HNQ60_002723 [Povalibacter uvarum]|uniref:Uncharacterized protein n=1 Tax=Povalibacter uvarum TaxID=732238 RepID=A0A841HP48_9GAMM|nr:hypothetical protein [Povalibacter uvarum]